MKQSFEIHFVNQHARSGSPRDFTNLTERFVINKGAARVMHISDHYEPRAIRHGAFDREGVDTKAVFESPFEPAHACAKINRR